ncbi:MAG: histidine phosphatase family protein [Actinomycetota bacterium]
MLILVRHGRTAANAAGQMQGRVDNPLDEVGIEQAEAIAAALGPVDRVVASPLLRATETARRIADRSGAELVTDDRWLELDFGIYDGLPIREVPVSVWDRWQTDAEWSPERGESLAELRARTFDACADLAAKVGDDDVVVVSHVSPIKAAVAWSLGLDNETTWRTHLDVASISRLAVRDGRPILVSFNEVHHLEPPRHRLHWMEHAPSDD